MLRNVLLVALASWAAPAFAQVDPGFRVNAAYGAWRQDHLPPEAIDFSAFTRLAHFGLWFRSDGILDGGVNRLVQPHIARTVAAAHAAGRKISITVGGWQSRTPFLGAASDSNRAGFIEAIASFVETNDYDGVDINIEPLQAEDAALYTKFIRELRARLDQVSSTRTLSASTFWQPAIFAQLVDEFDYIDLTTYNQSGTWAGWVTWHDAATYDGGNRFPTGSRRPMPSAHGDVEAFVAAGVPREKLAIGMNFYGRIWQGGEGTDTGGVTKPMQSWTVAPPPPANRPYYVLQPLYGIREYGSTPGYRWDAGAEAPYLSFDRPGSADDQFVSFDDVVVAHGKVRYVRERGIGGLLIWELGGGYQPDRPAGERDLLLQAVKAAAFGVPPEPAAISPQSAPAGTPGLELTLLGSGFTYSSIVRWNGEDRATVFVSSIELRAAIPASDLNAPGAASVTVFNPGPLGGTSAPRVFSILTAPVITGLSPSSGTAGGPAFVLTVTGNGFSPASLVEWNGSTRTTSFVGPSSVTAAIGASDLAAGGTAQITVDDPLGRSQPFAFPIGEPFSPPAFSDDFSYPDGLVTNENSASPRSSKWLVTEGSLFASGGQGWTGAPDTVVPNATSSNGTGSALFRALTQPSNFATEVSFKLTVAGFPLGTAAYDGVHAYLRYKDSSNFYQVSVRRRDGRTAIKKKSGGSWTTFTTPANAPPAGTPRSIRVLARNETDGSVVLELYAGGVLLARAVDSTAPLTSPGKVGVAGENVEFRFDDFEIDRSSGAAPPSPVPPVLTGIAPSSAAAGGPGLTLSVFGSGFSPSTVVEWGGSSKATTFVGASTVTAAIPASDLASTGTVQVTALDTGGRSNAKPFTVFAATGPAPAFFEPFSYPDGLITNENAASPRSAGWLVVEGSLFASGGQGWTGKPDTATPNAASSNGTGSALFRALTQRSDFATEVTLKVTVAGFPLGSAATDGAHVYLRYQDSSNFYQVSIRRRDGRTAIKRKKGGSWTTFATPLNGPSLGTQHAVRVVATNQGDGSVRLQLFVDGALLLEAVDSSSPILAAGRVGMAGENTEFRFDDFAVAAPGGSSPSAFLLAARPPAGSADEAFAFRDLYAFPNPARGASGVTIRFEAGLADSVELAVADASGRLLHSASFPPPALVDPEDGGGPRWAYECRWDAGGVGSGIYVYAVTATKAGSPAIRKVGKVAVIK